MTPSDVLAPLRRGRTKAQLVASLIGQGLDDVDAWAIARAAALVLLGERAMDGDDPMLGGEIHVEASELLNQLVSAAAARLAARSSG